MNISVEDQSQTLRGEPYISGGEVHLEFKCAHDKVQIMNGEVFCQGCKRVLTDKELGVEIA